MEEITKELETPKLDRWFKLKEDQKHRGYGEIGNDYSKPLKAYEIKKSNAEGLGKVVYFEKHPNLPHLLEWLEEVDPIEEDIITIASEENRKGGSYEAPFFEDDPGIEAEICGEGQDGIECEPYWRGDHWFCNTCNKTI